MAPDLSIIIVTWNSSGDILGCLRSVYKHAGGLSTEVHLVDNASQDDTVCLVKKHFPEVHILTCDRNLGFAAATNRALAHASGRNILLLNPDTLIRDRALPTLVDYLDARPEVGAVGPRLVHPNGKVQPACMRLPSLWTTISGWLLGGRSIPRNMQNPRRVPALSGAALMAKRSVIQEIGPLDTRFFMYGEDNDWCLRIHQAGWEIHCTPMAEIVHIGGQSAKYVPAETYVRRRVARLLFVQKHRQAWQYALMVRLYRLHIRARRWLSKGDARRYYEHVLISYNDKVGTLD